MTRKLKPIHFIIILTYLIGLAVLFYFIGLSMGI